MRSRRLSIHGLSLAVLLAAAPASAAVPPMSGTRALGIAGALRGSATGDAALFLNPSGMSMVRSYVLEAAYNYDRIASGDGHAGHVSIVDSTSGFNLAGGLYYTYISESAGAPGTPGGRLGRSGHEGGLALSVPIGQRFFIGATARYLRISHDAPVPVGTPGRVSGFSFDAGMTVRPLDVISVGFSATNINDPGTNRAPRTFGIGATVAPVPDLLLTFDGVMDFTNVPAGTERVLHFMGGAEYVFAKRVAARGGGGRRGGIDAGFVAAGLSLLAEVGALDVGFQRDLGGPLGETVVAVSARLFVPAP
jgi:hypothetical protein